MPANLRTNWPSVLFFVRLAGEALAKRRHGAVDEGTHLRLDVLAVGVDDADRGILAHVVAQHRDQIAACEVRGNHRLGQQSEPLATPYRPGSQANLIAGHATADRHGASRAQRPGPGGGKLARKADDAVVAPQLSGLGGGASRPEVVGTRDHKLLSIGDLSHDEVRVLHWPEPNRYVDALGDEVHMPGGRVHLQLIIAVVGGTGSQGGGLVDALLARDRFAVRVLTRNVSGESAQQLAERGVELVQADLNDPSTLNAAFEGAYGAFLVTNFWDPATGTEEGRQAADALQAAGAAGVEHVVWSTLPNSKHHSNGELAVHHFTNKALVDELVSKAGFARHTFVEAPMYFQNLTTMMGPQPLGDGRIGWAVPMDPSKRVIHAGDVSEVGKVVARAFEQPDRVGNGQHLAVAPGVISWNDIVATLNEQGHDLSVVQVPAEVYDGFFPGASELREMFQWFERYTYFGPDADEKLALTREVYPQALTAFASWAKVHMPAAAPAS